jgi:hypothetical protein
MKVWVSTLALLWLADVAVSALAGGWLLGAFDSEFLCLLAVLALPPAVLHFFIRRELRREGKGGRPGAASVWLGLPAAGFCAVLALASLAAAADMILLSGGRVTPARLRAANVVAAPLEVAARPWLALAQGNLHWLSESVLRATRYRFYLPDEEERFNARQLVIDDFIQRLSGGAGTITVPVPDDSLGPPGSPLALTAVSGPGFDSKRVVYSVTGEPPY